MRFRPRKHAWLLLLSMLVVACGGDDDGTGPSTPDPGDDLTPVVGSWVAQAVVVSPKANPSVSRDLVAQDGVTFSFTVSASGSYTATMVAFGQQGVETGTIRLEGSTIRFSVKTPTARSESGQWSRSGSQLILESSLLLDFNQDGTLDDLNTRFVLTPS